MNYFIGIPWSNYNLNHDVLILLQVGGVDVMLRDHLIKVQLIFLNYRFMPLKVKTRINKK